MKSTVITFPVLAKTGKPSRRPVVEQSPHPFGIALDRKQQALQLTTRTGATLRRRRGTATMSTLCSDGKRGRDGMWAAREATRLNTCIDHDINRVMRKRRWREVGSKPPATCLWHQQRVETCNPVMPLVVRQPREKSPDFAGGNALLNDRFAHLERCHT